VPGLCTRAGRFHRRWWSTGLRRTKRRQPHSSDWLVSARPREIYNPWYRGSRRYYGNINLTNIRVINSNRKTIINSINKYGHYRNGMQARNQQYVNRDAPHGFTAVSGATFVSGRNVRSQRLKADPREIAAAPVLARGSTLRPVANGAARAHTDRVRMLPLGGFQRNVVARQAPPAKAFDRNAGSIDSLSVLRHAGSPNVSVRLGSNVKVLGQHLGNGPVAGPTAGAPVTSGQGMPANPRPFGGLPGNQPRTRPLTSDVIPSAPALMREASVPQGLLHPNNALVQARQVQNGVVANTFIPMHQGGLLLARFAHPQDGDRPIRDANPREFMQQPRVSYISNGNDNPSRPISRPAETLPKAPQIQRATPFNRPMPQQQPQAMPQPASQYHVLHHEPSAYRQPAPQ
jgi:hypothetical protein